MRKRVSRRRVAGLYSIVEHLEPRRLLALFAPDVSFGNGGAANVPANDVLVLPDEKLLVQGATQFFYPDDGDGTYYHYSVSRLNADGTPDQTFGDGGTKQVGDESISRAGSRYFRFQHTSTVQRIVLYNTEIEADTSFSGDGVLPIPYVKRGEGEVGPVKGRTLTSMTNGDVIVSFSVGYKRPGNVREEPVEMVRLNADGSVDTTWGENGYARLGNGATGEFVTSNGIYFYVKGANGNELRRYKSDGTGIDTTFGGGDGAIPSPGSISEGPDGKIYFERDGKPLDSTTTRLYRLNADGSTDTSFGQNGSVAAFAQSTQLGTSSTNHYEFDAQGRIWISAGHTILRYSKDGVLDAAPYNGTQLVETTVIGFDYSDRPLFANGLSLSRFDEASAIEIGRDNVLYLTGDNANDNASVSLGTDGRLHAAMNGSRANPRAKSIVGVNLRLGAGNNLARVDIDIPATITTGAGNDTIVSSNEDDTIDAGLGANTIDAGNGDDTINVGLGAGNYGKPEDRQRIAAGDGDKTVVVRAGGATIDLGTGDSDVQVNEGNADNDITIAGGNNKVFLEGADVTLTIGGRGKNDIEVFIVDHALISTGDGADTFSVGDSATINSHGGNDTFMVATIDAIEPRPVKIDAGAGDDRITIRSQNYDGSGTFHLGAGDDYFSGGKGSQTVFGDAGNDEIDGGEGNDALFGGDGNDLLFSGDGARDSLNGGAGSDRARGDRKLDRFDAIEKLI